MVYLRFRIDRKLLLAVAIAAVPLELIALFGFLNLPIDGVRPGTSPWVIAYAIAALFIHAPALILIDINFPPGLFEIVSFAIGYADLLLLTIIVVFSYRLLKKILAFSYRSLRKFVATP
jgi:hypothetical protein